MRRKFSLSFFHVLLIILIAGGIGYLLGTNQISASWKNYVPIVSINKKNPPANQNLDMAPFYEVLDKVNRDYYDKSKINSQKILHGAISGALQSLDDPFTSFFPPKQNTDFKTQMAGEFSGIGAELGLNKDNKISVMSPIDESPADKAGIESGDEILAVDGQSTNGWTLPQTVEKIRGPKGTTVKLTVLHDKETKPTNLSIVRDTIQVKSVTGWVKNFSCTKDGCQEEKECPTCNTISYIRLSQFGDKTNQEWTQMINSLYPKMIGSKNFKGLVLDLRNNPGGYLQDAVFIASEFVKSGNIVSQADGNGEKIDMPVSRNGILLDIPVVVLINKGSASASEIVSGALRDHKRAILIGETSFGKGTIQQPVDLADGSSVHLSVGKWLTPNGTWVDKKGLTPDIKIIFDKEKSAKTPTLDNQLQRAIQELTK
ncbi:MAG: S41 family peptidase [Candidatus Levybacteria bacterium]|nr:S41 family peptidase [Candidatus Levybacteria bacterium]MBP9815375.1 S41 family peptidase [Candidatus Levybacteria bacterium]